MQNRRQFIRSATAAGVTVSGLPLASSCSPASALFPISLAQWSFNRRLFDGDLDPLDFPAFARNNFGIDAVEYVNQFFMDKAEDHVWLTELSKRCRDNGVRSVRIMCDREGDLGDPDDAARRQAVENHYKWVEAAQFLGCSDVRVNAASAGTWDEQRDYAIDGLRRLAEFAADYGLDVIVENHGGLSSNGQWLAEVMRGIGRDNIGTLPDFGNFLISRQPPEEYDRYQGVMELMPFAKGVSAKSYGFDESGNETTIDYRRMLGIVLDAGYRGYIGIEWEGMMPTDVEGVHLTQALLERLRDELADEYV